MDSGDTQEGREGLEGDALQQVLSLERRAEGMMRDAEDEAHDIIDSAQRRARDIRSQAEEEARLQVLEMTRRTNDEIAQQAERVQREAIQATENWLRHAEAHLQEAVEWVVRVVTASEEM